MTFVAVLLIAGGCGSGGGEDPVDPLMTAIVAGGNQRGSAADRLAELLNRDDDAGRGADHALVQRAAQTLFTELQAHTGTERRRAGRGSMLLPMRFGASSLSSSSTWRADRGRAGRSSGPSNRMILTSLHGRSRQQASRVSQSVTSCCRALRPTTWLDRCCPVG
jgi:hypothetical protein